MVIQEKEQSESDGETNEKY